MRRGINLHYQSTFLRKLYGFELAAVQQCDGLLMNESAENGARDKKERTEAGRMRLAWHVSLLQA